MEVKQPRLGAAILVEKEGKFLLAQRNKDNMKGSWIIPGGGVQWGETLQDAAVRELKEETNIDAEIVKFIGHKEIINIPGDYHSIVFFYLAKPKNSGVVVKDDVSDARFFSLDEIKNLDVLESVRWVLAQLGFWK